MGAFLSTALDALPSLGLATLFGSILGLNRQLHRKPAGLRTHALVALGAALVCRTTVSYAPADPDATSRVLQGIVTGIGFIGAGVIMHHDSENRVEGLTTAASIWLAAMLGLSCGTGRVAEATLALVIALLVLIVGGKLERSFARLFRGDDDSSA